MKLPNFSANHAIARASAGDSAGVPTDGFSIFISDIQTWARNNGGTIYGTSAQRTTSTTAGYVNSVNLAEGTIYFETDTALVYQLRQGAWFFVVGTQVIDLTLVAASTTIANPTSGALDLVVILRQDATGGRAVVWGSNFAATTVAIDKTASTISTFRFVLSGGKYVQVGTETTGMTA